MDESNNDPLGLLDVNEPKYEVPALDRTLSQDLTNQGPNVPVSPIEMSKSIRFTETNPAETSRFGGLAARESTHGGKNSATGETSNVEDSKVQSFAFDEETQLRSQTVASIGDIVEDTNEHNRSPLK